MCLGTENEIFLLLLVFIFGNALLVEWIEKFLKRKQKSLFTFSIILFVMLNVFASGSLYITLYHFC
jgi:hypothetical protein